MVELQEVISLDRIARDTECSVPQLRDGDPSQSALSRTIKRGQAIAKEASVAVTRSVNNILDGVV